jgi:hypothetical protein
MRIWSAELKELNAPVVQQMENTPSKKFRLVKVFGKTKRNFPTIYSLSWSAKDNFFTAKCSFFIDYPVV